jgi:hypothetical protein
MANVSRVNGLRPVKHIDGAPWNGTLNRYYVAASDAFPIFQGDLVTLAAFTDTQGQTVIPGVPSIGGTQGARKFIVSGGSADTTAVGVAVGFSINPLNLNTPQFRAASTAQYILVADAPDTVYEVQSAVASPPPTDLNGNATLTDANITAGASTPTALSLLTGQSGMVVGAYTNTATAILKVLGASQKYDNDVTSVNYKVLVTINNHQYSGGTGTAGV